jgi:hypothetical protein
MRNCRFEPHAGGAQRRPQQEPPVDEDIRRLRDDLEARIIKIEERALAAYLERGEHIFLDYALKAVDRQAALLKLLLYAPKPPLTRKEPNP